MLVASGIVAFVLFLWWECVGYAVYRGRRQALLGPVPVVLLTALLAFLDSCLFLAALTGAVYSLL